MADAFKNSGISRTRKERATHLHEGKEAKNVGPGLKLQRRIGGLAS